MTYFVFISWTGFGTDLGSKMNPQIYKNNQTNIKNWDCILRTKFEGKKRNVEGLRFGLELESLCRNKTKGYREFLEGALWPFLALSGLLGLRLGL